MSGQTAAERAAETKKRRTLEKLLSATDKLVYKGTEFPQVADIVAEAGVSQATYYNFFPTRADLVAAVFDVSVDGPLDVICFNIQQRFPDAINAPAGLSEEDQLRFARLQLYVREFMNRCIPRRSLIREVLAIRVQGDEISKSYYPGRTYFGTDRVPMIEMHLQQVLEPLSAASYTFVQPLALMLLEQVAVGKRVLTDQLIREFFRAIASADANASLT